MKEKVRRISGKKICILTICCILVASILFGVFYMFPGILKSLKPDSQLAKLVKNKAETAQYMPEAATLSSIQTYLMQSSAANSSPNQESYNLSTATRIDKNDFIGVLDSLGQIECNDTGKPEGYDIYEIKNEVKYVLEIAPYFNQWFKLPVMQERHGFISFPYYEAYSYFVETNDDATDVTITSVSTAAINARYIDFDNEKIKLPGLFASPRIYQTMQIRYYFDEQDREVVECSVYTVLVDDVLMIRDYNSNTNDYYPISYQYLKNVKDTSLTRYNITVSERYHPSLLPFNADTDGYDLRGKTPYGVTRDFIQLDYSNAQDIQLLRISQILPNDIHNRPATTYIAFYNLAESGVHFLSHLYDYCNPNDFSKVDDLSVFSQISSYSTSIDVARFFTDYQKLHTSYSKIKADIGHSDKPTRGITFTCTDNEDALMRALQSTASSLAVNLGANEDAVIDFQTAFSQRTTVLTSDFDAEKALDNLLFAISKKVVDGSVLKSEWSTIYKEGKTAARVKQIYGPFYKANPPVVKVAGNIFYDYNGLNYSNLSVDLVDEAYFDCRLAVALKSGDGDYHILYSTEIFFSATTLPAGRGDSWQTSAINISKEGVYTAIVVLTRIIDGKETVVFDTLVPAEILGFRGLNIPDTVNLDGTISSYNADGRGKTLKITVTVDNP